MIDLLIRQGTVVDCRGQTQADIAISGSEIVGVGREREFSQAARTIDATGKLVLPGLVDPHTHFSTTFGGVHTCTDFYTGTVAAAFGGVTTIVDFAFQEKGKPLREAIQSKREMADGKVVIDYGLHGIVTDANHETLAELSDLTARGIASFKLFMIYRKEGVMADDGALLAVMEEASKHKFLVGVHAENAAIAERKTDEFTRADKRSAEYFALSKPNVVEAEAINRAIYLAQAAGCALYIFHVSTKEGVELVRQARSKGFPVYAETITHYLTLTDEMYRRRDGINWIISPPLRKQADIEALWQAIVDGTISTVGSDDGAWSAETKKLGEDSFDKVINGAPGVEARLPIMFSEGVGKGRISVEKLVEVASTNPAKILGLYPKKGALRVGSDADVVLLDPNLKKTITVENLHTPIDWCPFEGTKVKGYPIVTISKGRVIVENGRLEGVAGLGEFLPRHIPDRVLEQPV